MVQLVVIFIISRGIAPYLLAIEYKFSFFLTKIIPLEGISSFVLTKFLSTTLTCFSCLKLFLNFGHYFDLNNHLIEKKIV